MPTSGQSPYPISNADLRKTLAAQAGSGNDPLQTSTPVSQTELTSTRTSPPGPPVPTFSGAPSGSDYENPGETYQYIAQTADTLLALSKRFDVEPERIVSQQAIPTSGFITPGQLLQIPNTLNRTLPAGLIFPDNEVVNSPSAADLQITEFIESAGGYLSSYEELVDGNILSGAEIVERVALESSVNPRFLLAFLDYRSNWVTGQPPESRPIEYPIGFRVPDYKGLYLELVLTATHLNAGYYGWRSGEVTMVKYPDRSTARLNPTPNAGTVALQYLFAKFYHPDLWDEALYGEDGFTARYTEMFGDPWTHAETFGPLFPEGLSQPTLELPFIQGQRWSLTGGPHYSWNTGSPRGALDFAPVTGEPACQVSKAWVTASAAGQVVRAANNVVVIDLDGDGYEQTGWTVVYVHIADQEQIAAGTRVELDDQIGHPSCERGKNTGTHVHIARKYNGEWLYSDGPLLFVLSGWEVRAGIRNYQGEMFKDGETVYANPGGNQTSIITR